jgi:hypothetical protein
MRAARHGNRFGRQDGLRAALHNLVAACYRIALHAVDACRLLRAPPTQLLRSSAGANLAAPWLPEAVTRLPETQLGADIFSVWSVFTISE